MKKYLPLLFLAFIAGFNAFSQSLSLSDSTGPLANNATVIKEGHVTDDEIVSHIFISNNTAHALMVVVKKVEMGVVAGSMNTFCWGLCFPPTTFVAPPMAVNGNTTDSIGFSGHYSPQGFSGITRIRYVFYDEANPADSVCVNVTYNAFPVGVPNVVAKTTLGNAFPNPASNLISMGYSIAGSAPATVVIRDIVGTKMKEIPLTDPEGKISIQVSDIPDGIYFYSLNLDGKPSVTRKLIIRH